MALTDRMSPVVRTVAILAVLAFVALVSALALRGSRAATERDAALALERRTFVVPIETERLDAAIRASESDQRGFLLSTDTPFFDEMKVQMRGVGASFARLQSLTADNPRQRANVAVLAPLVNARLKLLREHAGLANNLGVIKNIGYAPGRTAMAAIAARLALVRGEEERLLAQRRAAANAIDQRADRINFLLASIGAALTAMVVLAGLTAFVSMNRSRDATARARVEAGMRETLEARVAARTAELRTANARLIGEAQTREAAEDQVRQMQKMESIGQLTGGIAHDFNNMLAIVIGSLDMARHRLDTDPVRARTYIDNAEEGAKRAAQLTARLLAFSRQQTLIPTVIDANALVAAMSELLRRTIGEHVRLETVLAGGLWRSKVDASQVENAVLNLAVNARDAMESGGRLTIETANVALDDAYAALHADINSGQYVMIAVTDTGSGMPPEVVARAFDPFFTTKPVGKGTGLGLSQVFGFVKQSQGHVNVYSEPGRGTTIKLYLPRYFGEDETAAAAATVETMPRARSGETVLVVEDEAQVREMTVTALRDLGYVVRHAPNGAEALRLLSESLPVTLLFTDIVMPGITGRELADHALAARPGLRVLYTTGYTRNAVVHDGTLDPRTAFLAKPFNMADLANKVRQTIDGDSNAGARRSV